MDRPAGDTPKVGAGSWLQMGASKPPPSIAPQLHVLEGSSSPEGLPPRLLLLRFQNVPIFLQRQKVTPSTVGAQAAVWRPTASRTKVLQLLPHRLPAPPPPPPPGARGPRSPPPSRPLLPLRLPLSLRTAGPQARPPSGPRMPCAEESAGIPAPHLPGDCPPSCPLPGQWDPRRPRRAGTHVH